MPSLLESDVQIIKDRALTLLHDRSNNAGIFGDPHLASEASLKVILGASLEDWNSNGAGGAYIDAYERQLDHAALRMIVREMFAECNEVANP